MPDALKSWLGPLTDLVQSSVSPEFWRALIEIFKPSVILAFTTVALLAWMAWAWWRSKKGTSTPKRQLKEMINRGLVQEAAEIYLTQGDYDTALKLFIQARAFARAARVCEMSQQTLAAAEYFERAQCWNEAVEAYKKAGKVEKAGKILTAQGLMTEAAKLYEAHGLLGQAATVYQENHQCMDAAKLYMRLEQYSQAGDMYAAELAKQVRMIRGQLTPQEWQWLCAIALDGAKAYVQGGEKEKAADLYLKGENHREASALFQSLELWDKAVDALKKGSLFEEAAALYEKLGKSHEAHEMRGEFYKKKGMNLEAAEFFAKAGNFMAAGDLWVALGERRRAAECYKEAGDYTEAAALYSQVGDDQNAAICFEKAGVFEEAARHYGKLGDVSKRADLLIRAGNLHEAGALFLKEGLLDKAITVLQDISEDSQQFKASAALLGRIFFEKGMLGVALKKFQQAVKNDSVNSKNLDEFYHMGVICERMGEYKEAALIYEQIIAAHYDYSDVATRLSKLQQELSQSKSGGPKSKPELYEPTLILPSGASPSVSPHLEQPDRFELMDEIGRGGMGIVYKARDRILNRTVALKYLPANFSKSDLAVRNFRREAESAARLSHAGIVVVYDVGYDSRGNYIAMEYLEGHTIKDYVRKKGKLEVRDLFIILRQLANALDYAHTKKIIHRDIKTSNMMWCKGGTIKIMDFGLAKIMQDAQNSTTQISGTPYYMSPEQTLGLDVDHRTDVYSLGVSLYEMATGIVPFKEGDIGYHQVHTPVPDPLEKNPDLPPPVRDIIWKCMEKKPEYRFQSAAEIAKVTAQAHANWRELKKAKPGDNQGV